MSKHYLNIFTQRNSAILLLLGFASGLPLALTSGTLQARMTVENIDLKTIGIFSLVGGPTSSNFSGRRSWTAIPRRFSGGGAVGC